MNIMISGSNGLIGKNLKDALTQQGHNIIGLSEILVNQLIFLM